MNDSFCQRVVSSCEKHADRTAMRIVGDEAEIYDYRELLRQVRSVAYRIKEEKIGFGDRVALIGENHPCWAISYLATLYHGAVCVPLDPHGEIETITNFLENSEARLAFLSPDLTEKFQQIEEKLGRHIPAVVWRSGDAETLGAGDTETFANGHGEPKTNSEHIPHSAFRVPHSTNGFQKFEDWADTEFPESFAREIPPATGDDTALLIYTSGTTGTPKGVPLTHGNITAELDGIYKVLNLSEKEKILSLLPLFHAYLQIVNLWVATTYGCEVGYLKEMTPDELGRAMKQFKPSLLTTVPRLWYLFHKKIFDSVAEKPKVVQALFKTMLAANGFLQDSLHLNLGKKFFGQVHASFGGNIRFAITAGSRFDEKVAADFYKLGFTIIQGYGLTETSGAATATYETDNRVGSVGKPFFNAEVKIDKPDAEGIGEVLIRGAVVFKGYYKNPQATREVFTPDGWFRSGDLGRFDADGHLFIVGRAKDVIVLPNGKNVHPEDLEVHYLKSPLVEELAILGIEDKSVGKAGAEKLVAVVVPDFEYLKHEKISNAQTPIKFDLDNLGRELPEYQRVREYIVRSEPLPRTATRKIKRFELQKEIKAGTLRSAEKPPEKVWNFSPEEKALLCTTAGQAVSEVIGRNAREAAQKIHPQMNLEIDLGLDSLARAEVFAALEQAFSTEFEAEAAARALTVGEVIRLVEKESRVANGELEAKSGELRVEGETSSPTLDSQLSTLNSPLSTLDPQLLTLNWSKILRQADEDLPEIRSVLKNRPLFRAFAFTVYKGFNIFCKGFMRLEVEGLENLRQMRRPFLICPNHQSFLDPFVLCSTYPYEFFSNTFHVGASEFFENWFMKWVASMLQVVPVDPDTQLMRAMKAGAIGLKHEKILNIYPEGERAFDGDLHEFKKGAAILATELDLPILPVALDGLHNVWARRTWRIRPAKVKIRFGQAFYAKSVIGNQLPGVSGQESSAAENEWQTTTNEGKYEAVTAHLKTEIARMIDEMRQ